NDLPVQTQSPACSDGCHRVLDLKRDRAMLRDRYSGERNAMFRDAFCRDNEIAAHIDDTLAPRPVLDENRVIGTAGEKDHFSGTVSGHRGHGRISRIQYRSAGTGCDILDDYTLDCSQVLHRM